jgi:hypothetical protein
MRNGQSDGTFNGKTGHVEKVEIVMGLPYFVIKWDTEKMTDPTLYEMTDLKDLTFDPKWHQHEKDNRKVFINREEKDSMVKSRQREKQINRNIVRNELLVELRAKRHADKQSALASAQTLTQGGSGASVLSGQGFVASVSNASEFAPNNLTEENRRKNLNYDAKTYQVSHACCFVECC